MKHIRIPVTDRSPYSKNAEGAWFGYVYFWQCQPNGAVSSRLEWKSPFDRFESSFAWEEPQCHEKLAEGSEVPFEQDVLDIINDDYNRLVVAGRAQTKMGRQWIGSSGMVMTA